MTICVISQPRFFPGLHYLHRMLVADIFVIFDTVQYNPRHEENRAKLKTPNGTQWLTIPMRRVSRDQLIQDTQLDNNQDWQSKATRTIEMLYRKTPFYQTYAPEILDILGQSYNTLPQLDWASWKPALDQLEITCRFVFASDLAVTGKGSQLLLDICTHLGADVYLSGAFGKEYLDLAEFESQGVHVDFHSYSYPTYPQRFGDFVPYLSYLDFLFNAGLDRELVLSGGEALHVAS